MSDELRTTGVDVRGLLTVLGAHLYSTPIVAVRELVQNAHDSITRRRIEEPSASSADARISIDADGDVGLLRVTDNGSGLTADEVHAFLATIGSGYTRSLRAEAEVMANDAASDLIGQFGLGFLSAFVVADEVIVHTRSYQTPELSWRYHSTDGEKYTLTPGLPGIGVGTIVELRLKEKYRSLAAPEALRGVLGRYCCLLDVPVWLEGDAEPVNATPPPWRGGADLDERARRRAEMAFAARFEPVFEPLCTFPLAPHPLAVNDNEVSDAVGVLWVQDGGTYGSSDNRHLSVFVRGMMLDDDARDLLPYWAGFIGGVIESDRLVPTASREDLQRDEGYRATQEALTEAIISGLATIAHEQPEVWRRILLRHSESLRGTALCDDRLFDLLADVVPIPTSQGELTMPAIRKAERGRVNVAMGSGGGFEEMLFRSLKVPVARGERYAVLSFLRRYVDTRGGTLVEIGTDAGNQRLFQPAEISAEVHAWLHEHLCGVGEKLVPSRFAPVELPLVLVPDREVELKARLEADEADKRMATAALSLARQFTEKVDGTVRARLYLNVECAAVRHLVELLEVSGLGAGGLGAGGVGAGVPDRVEHAARLLRSVKVLLVSGGADQGSGGEGTDESGGDELIGALADIAATVDRMLEAPT